MDWTTLAQTLVTLVSGLFTGLQNVIETVKWDEIRTKLNRALNTVIKGVSWSKLGTDFLKGVNKIFANMQGALDTIDWTGIGTVLGSKLGTMISTVDWAKVAQLLSTAFVGALSALSGAMASFDWYALGNAIGTFLAHVDWGGIFLKVVQIAIQALVGLFGTIVGLLVGFFGSIVDMIAGYFKNKGAGEIISGLFKGIVNALKNVGSWIVNNVFKPIINAFKKAFGISSPSKEMQKQGKFISEGILKGIANGLKSIGSWIKSNVFDKIKGAFTTAFGIAGSVASKIVSVGKSVIGGIKKGVTDNWKNLKTTVSGLPGKIKEAYNNSIGKKFIDLGKKLGTEINAGIKDKWGKVKEKVGELPGKIKSAFDDKKGSKFSDMGSSITSGIRSGISGAWSSLSTWFKDKVGGLVSTGKKAIKSNSPSKRFRDEIGKTIPQGIAVGIDKASYEAVDSIESLANDLTSAAAQSISLPPIVGGQVIPYSIGKADAEEANTTLNQVLDMLKYNKDNAISIEEIQSVFTELFRRYMNVQLYLGDEQVARHANAGNVKLNRRYNTT